MSDYTCTTTQATIHRQKALGEIAGALIFGALMLFLRGLLLGVCAGWLVPSLVLTYPQWLLIALTFRLLIIRSVRINSRE